VFLFIRYMHMIVATVSRPRSTRYFFYVSSLQSQSLSRTNGSVKRHKSQKKHSTKDTKKQKKALTRKSVSPQKYRSRRERERTKTDRRQRQKRRGGETVWTRRRFRRAQTRAFLFFCSQNRELKKTHFYLRRE